MRRLDRIFLALMAIVALSLPAFASNSASCPDGATWHGQAPPHGTGYFCGYARESGETVRHGWGVFYHPASQAKIEECEYRDGVRHGRCTFYDAFGSRTERGSFTNGVRTGAWWFWSFPTSTGRRDKLTLPIGLPGAASARRRDVEAFLTELGAGATEATTLTEVILNYVDRDGIERRQTCGEHLCVGPGRIPDEPIYVALGPTSEQVERDRKLVAQHEAKARARIRDEERAARAEQARLDAEQRRIEREFASEERSSRECCRYCDTGKPCGDSCIARNKTCHKGPGCAC